MRFCPPAMSNADGQNNSGVDAVTKSFDMNCLRLDASRKAGGLTTSSIILIAIAVVALAGCGSPKIAVRTMVEICPVQWLRLVSCPSEMPTKSGKIQGDWEDEVGLVLKQCRLALRTWERVHASCAK